MKHHLHKENKRSLWLSVAIKVTVFALLIFALYKQFNAIDDEKLRQITDHLRSLSATLVLVVFICILFLMLLNWGFEAYKWKLLISKINPIRLIRTFKAVWTGVTLGLFTPNRVGEFGGRILYVPRKYRIKAVIVSLIGSFSQNLATMIIGIICLVIYIDRFESLTPVILGSVILIGAVAIALLLIAYYNFDMIMFLFKRNKFLKRVYHYTEVLQLYTASDYTRLFLISTLRYAVYTAQYLIFLRLFGAEISIAGGITAIGVIYIAQTVIPTFAIVEVLTRGTIATVVLSRYDVNDITSFAASTCLWLVNLILPAILGYIFIIRYNFFKSRQS